MLTFSYTPDLQAQGNRSTNVKQIKFGEGYEQRLSYGFNNVVETWNLTFANRDASEGDAIDAFFTARAAVEAFVWTPPGSSTAKVFVCRQWQKSIVNGSLRTVTATLEQVYEAIT